MQFWLGGYGAGSGGNASGIGVLLAGAADDGSAGGQLRFAGDAATVAASPSWLTAHPTLDVVYAALERSNAVQAFRRTGETALVPLGASVEAGTSLCHVAVAPDGASLVASCWGDGRVVRMSLDAAGRPSAPVVAAAASDPFGGPMDPSGVVLEDLAGRDAAMAAELAAASRSLRAAVGDEFAAYVPGYDEVHTGAAIEGGMLLGESADVEHAAPERVSRAHAALFLPDGRIATTDLGFDLVRIWRPTPGGLSLDHEVVLPRGTGPRHMVLHPSGHLHVVTEHSCEIFTLGAGADGRWRLIGGIAATSLRGIDDSAAELTRSRDGEFLYAGLRGSNTIATMRVRGAGERIEPVGLADAGVTWPRHHVVVRDTLLVAGQRSDEVVSLTLDARTGVPGRIRHRVEVPTPSCLLPAR